MQEPTSVQDVQALLLAGFSDWASLGDVKVSAFGDLSLFNYTQKAQFAARWNFLETVSRGLIINHRTGEIVARPFDKFFNYGEGGRKASGHIVTVTEKMDGSLGVMYRQHGEKYIATRGAFNSEQAAWASEKLHSYKTENIPDKITPLFEIIYPANRVVVDYNGAEHLVLLAARNRHTGDYLPFFPDVYELAHACGFDLPRVFTFNNMEKIIATTGGLSVNEEGYVVEFSDGSRWKIKGDRYLEMHRLISGLSFKNTLEAMAGGGVDSIRAVLPDEFIPRLDGWVSEINIRVEYIKAKVAEAMEVAPTGSRKDFAEFAKSKPEITHYLFSALDQRPLEPMIYKREFENRAEAVTLPE